MIAVVSDIHGNLEALNAVLDDLVKHSPQLTLCLGDLVGYGPNPRECVDLAMNFDVTLLGNHDEVVDARVAIDLNEFGPEARRFLDWTRYEVAKAVPSVEQADSRMRFLSTLPKIHIHGSNLFVHGGPNNPVHEYIFPMDRHNEPKMKTVFESIDKLCFHGHTHLPGIMTESCEFYRPDEIAMHYEVGNEKLLCNVGSVGLSRDKDPRATYVLFDGRSIHFRRISYDADVTRQKLSVLENELNKG